MEVSIKTKSTIQAAVGPHVLAKSQTALAPSNRFIHGALGWRLDIEESRSHSRSHDLFWSVALPTVSLGVTRMAEIKVEGAFTYRARDMM